MSAEGEFFQDLHRCCLVLNWKVLRWSIAQAFWVIGKCGESDKGPVSNTEVVVVVDDDRNIICFASGYSTHIVGKWHLGFYEWPYTPTYRGFDSFYGFYVGAEDHFNHERYGIVDLRDNKEPVKDKEGVHSARLFAKVILV